MLAGKGIWQRAEYKPVTTQEISGAGTAYRGWKRVRIKPLNIRRTSRGSVYLEDDSPFSLRIPHESLQYFSDPGLFLGKHLEVHGWVSRHHSRYTMLVRHPSAVQMEQLVP